MIFLSPQNKAIRKVITIAVLALFVMSSIAGAAESVICVGLDETHVVEQEHFPLAACHAVDASYSESKSDRAFLWGSNERHENSCVDIALNSSESSISSHSLKRVFPKELPWDSASVRLPQSASASALSAKIIHHQAYPAASPLASLRTVVLLI